MGNILALAWLRAISPLYSEGTNLEFGSPKVQKCAVLLQCVGFGEARAELEILLGSKGTAAEAIEARALLARILVERDDLEEQEEVHADACGLLAEARQLPEPAAVYHLGIVNLLAEDSDGAETCFVHCRSVSRAPEERRYAEYGAAAVLNQRKQGAEALKSLASLESLDASSDFMCLLNLLKGNCFRGLGDLEEAHRAYLVAQRILPHAKTFSLKHWVFFNLGVIHSRRGERIPAKTLFESVLSITHPVDFRRLHRLAQDELSRLELKVEVLLDPATGDVTSNRGYLSLRRKPILVQILRRLIEASPTPVTKEELYTGIWGGEYHPLRHDGLIYSHMQRLRQILLSDAKLNDFIQTLPEGYQIGGDVKARLKGAV